MPDETAEPEYEKLRPYWEAWKANNERPSDQEQSKYWEGMVEIFRAIATGNSSKANSDALNFVTKARPHWLSRLKESENWDKQAERLQVYRGVTDEAATLLRKRLRDSRPNEEAENRPICYTTDIGVARGFARKGHIDGCVYSILVPLETVVFADLDGLYREGGAHKEKEVVVWRTAAVAPKLIDSNVAPLKHGSRSRRSKREWESKREKLLREEAAPDITAD